MWGTLFTTTYDGDIVLQPEEVESGQFMSVEVRQIFKSERGVVGMEYVCCAHHVWYDLPLS